MTARRPAILRELGLAPLWRLRVPAVESGMDTAPGQTGNDDSAEIGCGPESPAARSADGSSVRLPAMESGDRPAAIAGMDWDGLAAAVAECRACALCQTRKQAVLGVGDRQADWLFVGEGPGAEEDERGEPFVGQAGKLLDAMLSAIGLRRGRDVYIANAVKCRPPNNRTPEAEETAACRPYLARQIALIRPRLIVALGRPAAQTLLDADVKIGASRGRLFDHGGIPVVVTYHPAYLLRNLPDKAKAWEDLLYMRKVMGGLKES